MNIQPTEIREITQKEIEIIVSFLKETDEIFAGEENEQETREGLLNGFTKVFVFSVGVYVVSISFDCINTTEVHTNKKGLALGQFTSRFFIKNNGECHEVNDDEFLDVIY